jgi:drug/metabolite transporter (DMT)-like permease
MKLGGTYLLSIMLIFLLATFVWGWYEGERTIPEVIFAGLLGLIGTLVGYIWMKDKPK